MTVRTLLPLLLSLAALATITLIVAFQDIPIGAQRAEIETQAELALGLPLEIDGRVSIRLLPNPTVALESVSVLAPAGWARREAITIETLELTVEAAALLDGRWVITDADLLSPNVFVEMAEDGTSNLDPLLTPPAGGTPAPLEIRRLGIENGRLHLLTPIHRRLLWVRTATMTAPRPGAPTDIEARLDYQGRAVEAALTVAPTDPTGGNAIRLRLHNAAAAASLEIDGRVAASNDFRGSARLTVADPAALIRPAWATADGSEDDDPAEAQPTTTVRADLDWSPPQLSLRNVVLEGALGTLTGTAVIGPDAARAELNATRLDGPHLEAMLAALTAADGAGLGEPGRALDLALTAARIDGLPQSVEGVAIGLRRAAGDEVVQLHTARATLDGTVRIEVVGDVIAGGPTATGRFDGDATIAAPSMSALLAPLTLEAPPWPALTGAVSVTGALSVDADGIVANRAIARLPNLTLSAARLSADWGGVQTVFNGAVFRLGPPDAAAATLEMTGAIDTQSGVLRADGALSVDRPRLTSTLLTGRDGGWSPTAPPIRFVGQVNGTDRSAEIEGAVTRGDLILDIAGLIEDALGRPHWDLEARLRHPSLLGLAGLDDPALEVLPLDLRGRIDGGFGVPLRVTADARILDRPTTVTATRDPNAADWTVLGRLAGLDWSAALRLSPGQVALDVGASGPDLTELARLTGLPSTPAGPVALDLSGVLSGAAAQIDALALTVGASDAHAHGTIDLAPDVPVVDLQVHVETLDMADLAPQDRADGPVFDPTPIPLRHLAALDGRIGVTVGRYIGRRPALRDIAFDARFDGGGLSIPELRAIVADAPMRARIEAVPIGTDDGRVRLSMTARDIDFGTLLAETGVSDRWEGRADIVVDVTARGTSEAAWAASADGRLGLALGRGVLRDTDIDLALWGVLRRLIPFLGDRDTPINCFANWYEMRDGIAELEAWVLDTPTMVLAGTGEVDLRTEQVDIRLTPRSKRLGPLSLSTPLTVTGPLADPAVIPDPAGLAGETLGALYRGLLSPVQRLLDLPTAADAQTNACKIAVEEIGALD